ncbi:MAG: hypothetical protein HPY58_01890 [Firmicutes bacterium]|nr:hypothetical protein [Bacillota bacterium]
MIVEGKLAEFAEFLQSLQVTRATEDSVDIETDPTGLWRRWADVGKLESL